MTCIVLLYCLYNTLIKTGLNPISLADHNLFAAHPLAPNFFQSCSACRRVQSSAPSSSYYMSLIFFFLSAAISLYHTPMLMILKYMDSVRLSPRKSVPLPLGYPRALMTLLAG